MPNSKIDKSVWSKSSEHFDRRARQQIYADIFFAAVPRLVSELDRDPFSSTYGSFDREFWAWATKDFSNVDLQRGIYVLAVAWSTKHQNNALFGHPRIRALLTAGVQFWRERYLTNHSYDHHYSNEFSFVGAAFTLFDIAMTYRLLEQRGVSFAHDRHIWLDALRAAAEFLTTADETHGFISNHRLGAACGLFLAANILGVPKYRQRAHEIGQSVRERYNKEGWFDEYGGADPGYQTLTMHFAASYCVLSGDESFKNELLAPAYSFLQYFVHPDGSIGGTYGGRGSNLCYPSGFEALAGDIPEALLIAQAIAQAAVDATIPLPGQLDIRNFVPMMTSYAQIVADAFGDKIDIDCGEQCLPHRRNFERFFPQAGLYVRSDPARYIVLATRKGGALFLFPRAQTECRTTAHLGYIVESIDGRQSSAFFQSDSQVSGLDDLVGGEHGTAVARNVTVTGHSYFVSVLRVFTPLRFLIFRLFTNTLGRNKAIANWFKREIITGRHIHRRKSAGWSLRREIQISSDGLIFIDRAVGKPNHEVYSVRAGREFTTVYMASTRYYRMNDVVGDCWFAESVGDDLFGNGVRWRSDEKGLHRLD